MSHFVTGIDPGFGPPEMVAEAREAWDAAVELGEKYGYRNAQATVLAPTGTIGLLMDCDTTGVEPDFALVKFKKLAGGGYFKIANDSIAPALRRLGYSEERIEQIIEWCGGETFEGPLVFDEAHKAKHFVPGKENQSTKMAVCVVELQRRLPKARVVYCRCGTVPVTPRSRAAAGACYQANDWI